MADVLTTPWLRLDNILYATDFSECSELSLPFAIALARRYGSTLHALHVLTPNPLASGTPEFRDIVAQADTETAFAYMQKLDSEMAGVQYETVVDRAFSVWEGVEQAIDDCSADLIVLGTHGRTGGQRLLLGSTAEEIFRQSWRPVLTVGPATSKGTHGGGRFHRVLFATDYSPASIAAAPYAALFAQNDQARLLLLHVARPIDPAAADRRSEVSVAEMIHKLYETVPQNVPLLVPPEVAIEYGRPAEKIIETARHRSADLIVLGVRGAHRHIASATHFERATAHEVVAHAPCPVLTVREPVPSASAQAAE
jgi:nucleotide-binding universal stress UspA family protein